MSRSPDFQAILRIVDAMIDCRSLLRNTDLTDEERAHLEAEMAVHAETIWAYLKSLDSQA